MKQLTLTALMLIWGFHQVHSQSKITLEDRQNLLSESVRTELSLKLNEISIELTSLVDFNKKCDYYFGTILKENNQILINIKNCDDAIVGTKSVGVSIENAPVSEQAVVYFYNLRSILENPEMTTEVTETIISTGKIDTEHDSRYFFSPTAYNLKKGEFYYNTLYFFLHDIQVGLDDHLSIGLGSTIIGIPMYFNAKASFPLGEKTHLAIGDMPIIGTYDVDFFGNLAYATLTRGSKHTNISFSIGALSTTDNDITSKTFSAVYNLGAMAKATEYVYFVTENYLTGYNSVEYAYFYSADFVNTFEERFTVRDNFLFGISGVRIIRKSNELASWQFGLAYIFQMYGDYPDKYKQIGWDVWRSTGTQLIAFPMFAYTKKFKLE